MGIQTMGSEINGQQQSYIQSTPSPLLPGTMGSEINGQEQSYIQSLQSPLLPRQNSWYNLTLNELEHHLRELGKPLGSMSLDELLKNVWMKEESQYGVTNAENASSATLLQRQASLTLARALCGKTLDEVWREIQQGQRKRYGEEMIGQDRIRSLGEMTLEDFLIQVGLFTEAPITSAMGMDGADAVTPQILPLQMVLSPSPSTGTLSDTTTTSGRKRDAPDALEKTLERKLRRKIKNRESAARSRARKQAYHNELVSKVSRLEEQNTKLKKEKELEKIIPWGLSPEPRYQLRRTSSASF